MPSDGHLTDSRSLPWYVSAVLLSQPLHFGDYSGMPLKIVWALTDAAVIVILLSGLYLWVARGSSDRAPPGSRHDRIQFSVWRTYRSLAAFAITSSVRLAAALVGDGLLDVLGWMLLLTASPGYGVTLSSDGATPLRRCQSSIPETWGLLASADGVPLPMRLCGASISSKAPASISQLSRSGGNVGDRRE